MREGEEEEGEGGKATRPLTLVPPIALLLGGEEGEEEEEGEGEGGPVKAVGPI